MNLAEKIIKLRKQVGWSQEELAEQLDVSRQSVSKWESGNSVPDLKKIVKLASLFSVSTDDLLTAESDAMDTHYQPHTNAVKQINLQQALSYSDSKMVVSVLTIKGIILSLCSVIPLFLLLTITNIFPTIMSQKSASVLGLLGLLILVATAAYFLIKTTQYQDEHNVIEKQDFELRQEVRDAFNQRLRVFIPRYHRILVGGIFLCMVSFVPLVVVNSLFAAAEWSLVMVSLMFIMIAIGIALVVSATTQHNVYKMLLQRGIKDSSVVEQNKRILKLSVFYWALLSAIYLAWSLWSMDWAVTWILFPVGALLYVALAALFGFLKHDKK